jgi:O-antigen/teichoic acid export membrane protein
MVEPAASVALRFFEGALWTTARNLLQALLSLAALAVVARELGPATYGLFGVAMLVYSAAELACGGALTDSIVQRKDVEPGHLDATFWLSTGLALGVGALMAWGNDLLAQLAGDGNAALVLAALAALLPLAVAARVPMAILARDLQFKTIAQIGALATILSCATGIALALGGAGIWSLAAMEAVRAVATSIGAFLAVAWRPGKRGRARHLQDLWRFNTGMLATYSLGYADLYLPRLLVSHLLGAQALGLFMLAMRVYGELSRLLTDPLHGVAMATCARLQDAVEELRRSVLGLYSASRIVVFPVFLGMAAVAPWWIPLLFGPRWTAAVLALQLLMLGGVRLGTGAYNSAILLGTGHVRASAMLFAAGCAVSLLAFPLLAPWGVAGAAVAVLIKQFAVWPLAMRWIGSATGLKASQQLAGTAAPLVAAVFAALSIHGTSHGLQAALGPGAATALAIAVGATVYLALLRVLAPHACRTVLALLRAFARRDRERLEALLARPA